MFAVQIESDAVVQGTASIVGSNANNAMSTSPGIKQPRSSKVTADGAKIRSTTSGRQSGKPSGQSRMSEGGTTAANFSRRASVLRSLWNHNDFLVCKIISILAKSRMQIFTYCTQREQKEKMKGRIVRFVNSFI